MPEVSEGASCEPTSPGAVVTGRLTSGAGSVVAGVVLDEAEGCAAGWLFCSGKVGDCLIETDWF